MNYLLFQPVIAGALAVALSGCWSSERIEAFGGPTMGSSYSIQYVRGKDSPDRELLKGETGAILAELDRQLSTYRADSLVEQFNQAPAGSCQAMPGAVLQLVEAGRLLNQQSQGAFDLTLEPLLDLWGFGPKARGEQVPAPELLAAARQRSGMQYLRVDGEQLCKDADIQLDFNGIAAGYAVDRIVQRLNELGVDSYLVEVTGELKAAGRKPDGQLWRIGLEAPQEGQRVAQRILALDGYGISTSGDYRNYFEENGRRYSHTLDPAAGAPVMHKLAAVTVADRSALRADGLSTVLMVLGPERGLAFAERQGIAAFFVTRAGEGFVTQSTRAFQQLFAAEEQ
ncbi:FAD:protein FMN transferase [Pseudomonas sp.]|uniref:FAD:protein FMN transferase n=1 Tax=Pseudomonas sp. TaxID=306 RepID=UPI00273685A7|nr:FAD:protein FMN transferase [Pseudomonas sp.]MDP3814130.1 FAD:protein FMN transferase [Pseudomonas sp.]